MDSPYFWWAILFTSSMKSSLPIWAKFYLSFWIANNFFLFFAVYRTCRLKVILFFCCAFTQSASRYLNIFSRCVRFWCTPMWLLSKTFLKFAFAQSCLYSVRKDILPSSRWAYLDFSILSNIINFFLPQGLSQQGRPWSSGNFWLELALSCSLFCSFFASSLLRGLSTSSSSRIFSSSSLMAPFH